MAANVGAADRIFRLVAGVILILLLDHRSRR